MRIEFDEDTVDDVRRMFASQTNWLFTHGIISPDTYDWLCQPGVLEEVTNQLVANGHIRIGGRIRKTFKLLRLREYNRDDFPMPIIVARLPLKKQVICFVGHRDNAEMRRSLQYNLASVLRQFRVIPSFQDVNYLSDLIFERVKKEIIKSDFCIFDNRGTQNKPNVYVEIGMAKMLGKPVVFFEKRTRSTQQLEGFPSDFSGFSTFRYRSYKDLFYEFGLQLPFLLRKMKLCKDQVRTLR